MNYEVLVLLSFIYAFDSEEYDEYFFSPFTDAFTLYISEPSIKGRKNMAIRSSGDGVTVNAINNDNSRFSNRKHVNPDFYIKNEGQTPLD